MVQRSFQNALAQNALRRMLNTRPQQQRFAFVPPGTVFPAQQPMQNPMQNLSRADRFDLLTQSLAGLGAGFAKQGRPVVGARGINMLPGRGAAIEGMMSARQNFMDNLLKRRKEERDAQMANERMRLAQLAAQRDQSRLAIQQNQQQLSQQLQPFKIQDLQSKTEKNRADAAKTSLVNATRANMIRKMQSDPNYLNSAAYIADLAKINPETAAKEQRSIQAQRQKQENFKIKNEKLFDTVDQAKAGGFYNRLKASIAELNEEGADKKRIDIQGTDYRKNLGMAMGGYLPVIGDLVGADYRKYDRAKRDFINAILRRESGAVISASEFDNADKQYFPVPGDSSKNIEAKRRARQIAMQNMLESAGPRFMAKQTGSAMLLSNQNQQGAGQLFQGGTTTPISPERRQELNKKFNLGGF